MAKTSVDFLIEAQRGNAQQLSDARQEQSAVPQAPTVRSTAEGLVEKAVALFGGQILNALHKTSNQSLTVFDLVDVTQMNIQTLHQVLDAFASTRYGWVALDKADLKGNYIVRLTESGKKYLDRLMSPA
jgi:hypothetical protein